MWSGNDRKQKSCLQRPEKRHAHFRARLRGLTGCRGVSRSTMVFRYCFTALIDAEPIASGRISRNAKRRRAPYILQEQEPPASRTCPDCERRHPGAKALSCRNKRPGLASGCITLSQCIQDRAAGSAVWTGYMVSLIRMTDFYLVGAFAGKTVWKSLAAILTVAEPDMSYRIYASAHYAQAHGIPAVWPAHGILDGWLVLSAFAAIFLLLGRGKHNVRARLRMATQVRRS